MPRKTKEQKDLEKDIKENNKTASSNSEKKVKKTTTRKNTTKKTESKIEKKNTSKKSSSTKKNTSRNKIETTKTTTAKKTTSKSSSKKVEIVEYYDLPYRYNQTIVKVLAQTPTKLFVYWDISDEDRNNFVEKYGEQFFENTKPVLRIYNDTKGYSFEVEINDFANSWYLHISDSKCDYRIELGRRPIFKNEIIKDDYIYISTSNEIEAPNDRILFDSTQKQVFFRNVKTGYKTEKNICNISLLRNMGKIYNIYDLYKAIYKNENIEEIYDLYNPSSSNSSF